MDTIVVNDNGILVSLPLHVRFGKFKVFKSKEKIVTISVNDVIIPIGMKLDKEGIAYLDDLEHTVMYISRAQIQAPTCLPPLLMKERAGL
jgi:phosphatidate phosphatase PAH1